MIANQIISNTLSPLKTSDTGEQALTMMNLFHVRHLPIVNNEQLLGIVSEEDILDHDLNEPIGSYSLSLFRAYSFENEHIFELMGKMANYNLTVLPIVDEEENYLGLANLEEILHLFAKEYSFAEPGSIIVIKSSKYNYSMSEIARAIESEGATILSSFITNSPSKEYIHITVKINHSDASRAIAVLKRFEYEIEASFSEEIIEDGIQDRYDSLMRYLDV
jgi:CBS domain-containing protein